MDTTEIDNRADKNLVEGTGVDSFGHDGSKSPSTKKRSYRIRRIADPHIRAHMSNGRPYYYYCRGTDKEIYMGDADTILQAVKGNKLASGKNRLSL